MVYMTCKTKRKKKQKKMKSYIVDLQVQVKATSPEKAEKNVHRYVDSLDIPKGWFIMKGFATLGRIR